MEKITEHFWRKNLACKHCGELTVLGYSIELLEKARVLADIPFIVTSGYRCPKHPDYTKTSSHYGYAYDISTPDFTTRGKVLFALILAGFRRIGIGENFIHADNDPTKLPGVWHYYKNYIKKD